MKKYLSSKYIPAIAIGAGAAGFGLRLWFFAAGTTPKGLLDPSHLGNTVNFYIAVIALAALICAAALFVGAYFATRGTAVEGGKTLTIEVVHGNGETKEFSIRTDAEYLGEALLKHEEIGVIGENGPYGLYIKEVDGEKASDADQTFWSVSLNGESLMVGADQQPIADGEHYELVLTKW